MTFRVVRLDTTSIYFWMLGVTVMLVGVAAGLESPADAAHLYGLGALLMITGLVIPVVVGLGTTEHDLWQQYQARGGDA